MSNICVVHLVRKKNGLEPFGHFLRSYLEHPAGIDHDLFRSLNSFSVILDKNWLLKLYQHINLPGELGRGGSIRPGQTANHGLPWHRKLARKWPYIGTLLCACIPDDQYQVGIDHSLI